ncbi:MAG TPA: hypothetical protein VMJ66_08650 [Geobacteraceae bacterium]|nr:hypothetical protein [Geobacteraceae bacterium]
MKNIALRLAFISSILLLAMGPVQAAEQKTVFNTESMKYETGTGSERCRDKCDRKSGPDVKSFLSQGWNIVSSSAKEVTAEQHWYTPCNTCLPHGCVCVGTEYVLQKDVPAPQIETGSDVITTPGKETRTEVQPPKKVIAVSVKDTGSVVQPLKAETQLSEVDLLVREIDSLKKENALLRQEIESLRKQLRAQPQ